MRALPISAVSVSIHLVCLLIPIVHAPDADMACEAHWMQDLLTRPIQEAQHVQKSHGND